MRVGPEAPRGLPEAQHHVLALEAFKLLRIFDLLGGLVQLFDLLVDRSGLLNLRCIGLRFFGFVQFLTSSLSFLAGVVGLEIRSGIRQTSRARLCWKPCLLR